MSTLLPIGITTYGRNTEGSFTLPGQYVDAVRRAGGTAVALPPGSTEAERSLELLAGIVFVGGGDIAPGVWGGRGVPTNYAIDGERDAFELALAHAVLAAELPSLWICRGLQLLNVALGGTLIEHIPDEVAGGLAHRGPEDEPVPHLVRIAPDSRLAATLGTEEVVGASWHHQAIAALGRGLRAVGRAPDGLIEAVELEGAEWLAAVQWHPELDAATDPLQQRLFDALVARAARRRSAPPPPTTDTGDPRCASRTKSH